MSARPFSPRRSETVSPESHVLIAAGLVSAAWSTARGEDGVRHSVATETATHASRPTVGVALGVVAADDVVEGVALADALGVRVVGIVFGGVALADALEVAVVGIVVGPALAVSVLTATDAEVPGDVVAWGAPAQDTSKPIVPSTVMSVASLRTPPSCAEPGDRGKGMRVGAGRDPAQEPEE